MIPTRAMMRDAYVAWRWRNHKPKPGYDYEIGPDGALAGPAAEFDKGMLRECHRAATRAVAERSSQYLEVAAYAARNQYTDSDDPDVMARHMRHIAFTIRSLVDEDRERFDQAHTLEVKE